MGLTNLVIGTECISVGLVDVKARFMKLNVLDSEEFCLDVYFD